LGHLPLRTCILCRRKLDKSQLLRIVKYGEEFSLDETHKKDGRGAYVCKSKDCFEKLCKQKALNRAFKTEVPQEIYQKIGEEIEQN